MVRFHIWAYWYYYYHYHYYYYYYYYYVFECQGRSPGSRGWLSSKFLSEAKAHWTELHEVPHVCDVDNIDLRYTKAEAR